MLVVSRLLTVLAVVLLTAQPVMACCLAGHSEPQIEMTEDGAPPCHMDGAEMKPGSEGVSGSMKSSADCPGCLDCDNPAMQAQTASDPAALPHSTYEMPVAILAAQFPGFEHPSINSKTGPPHPPPSIPLTPLILKQRLLI